MIAVDVSFSERDQVVTYIFDDPEDKWSRGAERPRPRGLDPRVGPSGDAGRRGLRRGRGRGEKGCERGDVAGRLSCRAVAEPRPLVLPPYQELTTPLPPSATTSSPATTTVRRGGCRRSSSTTARNCRRSASPPRCSPAASAPSRCRRKGHAADRRPPDSTGSTAHRRPGPVGDVHQLSRAGLGQDSVG